MGEVFDLNGGVTRRTYIYRFVCDVVYITLSALLLCWDVGPLFPTARVWLELKSHTHTASFGTYSGPCVAVCPCVAL